MAERDSSNSQKPGPARLFWLVGLIVGIFAGGAVAIAVTGSTDRLTIGGN